MAKRSSKGSSKSSSGSGKLLLGAVLGAGMAATAGYLYLHPEALRGVRNSSGIRGSYPGSEPGAEPAEPRISQAAPAPKPQPPVQPAPAAPLEVAPPSKTALAAGQAPFAASEEVFEAAAPLYRKQCAACHGSPSGKPRKGNAPQFWGQHAPSLGHKTPSAIYTAIAKGSPNASGHAFAGKLTSQQIWQLTLLLQQAGDDLPDPVRNLMGD
ncbi:c-type cytochrome [Terriglobus tenax]|uniref:c-type cytochrome n=1 Tax=Terriglobus tenax TaxID=1111115 RepID=UPI0021E06678|nr:cytochrome c [Terriglobus tenax]